MKCITRVRIDFFKPTGFADTWLVETEDRGQSIRAVLAQYPQDMNKYINFIVADFVNPDHAKMHRVRATITKKDLEDASRENT